MEIKLKCKMQNKKVQQSVNIIMFIGDFIKEKVSI